MADKDEKFKPQFDSEHKRDNEREKFGLNKRRTIWETEQDTLINADYLKMLQKKHLRWQGIGEHKSRIILSDGTELSQSDLGGGQARQKVITPVGGKEVKKVKKKLEPKELIIESDVLCLIVELWDDQNPLYENLFWGQGSLDYTTVPVERVPMGFAAYKINEDLGVGEMINAEVIDGIERTPHTVVLTQGETPDYRDTYTAMPTFRRGFCENNKVKELERWDRGFTAFQGDPWTYEEEGPWSAMTTTMAESWPAYEEGRTYPEPGPPPYPEMVTYDWDNLYMEDWLIGDGGVGWGPSGSLRKLFYYTIRYGSDLVETYHPVEFNQSFAEWHYYLMKVSHWKCGTEEEVYDDDGYRLSINALGGTSSVYDIKYDYFFRWWGIVRDWGDDYEGLSDTVYSEFPYNSLGTPRSIRTESEYEGHYFYPMAGYDQPGIYIEEGYTSENPIYIVPYELACVENDGPVDPPATYNYTFWSGQVHERLERLPAEDYFANPELLTANELLLLAGNEQLAEWVYNPYEPYPGYTYTRSYPDYYTSYDGVVIGDGTTPGQRYCFSRKERNYRSMMSDFGIFKYKDKPVFVYCFINYDATEMDYIYHSVGYGLIYEGKHYELSPCSFLRINTDSTDICYSVLIPGYESMRLDNNPLYGIPKCRAGLAKVTTKLPYGEEREYEETVW